MTEPMTDEQLTAYLELAEKVHERFGDNWQLVDDADWDEVSVRTEDSTLGFYTEMFKTSQTGGDDDDPLEVAGFLAAAIDNVPRMAAAIRQAEAERDRLAEQVKRVRARHRGVCFGACRQEGECSCAEADLFCEECNERWPCSTVRDLDKAEAGQ